MTPELASRGHWPGRKPLYMSLVPNQGWVTFVLLSAAMLSVIWSVQSARWTETSLLSYVVLAGLVTGLALAKVRLHGLILQGMALVLGALTVLWFAAGSVKADTWSERVAELGERLGLWFTAAFSDGISSDTLPFALALVVLTWLLGYICGWFAFRYRNIWVPLVLAGIGILTNLSYLPSDRWALFFVFLIFAMLAVAWMSIVHRRSAWHRQYIRHSSLLGSLGLYDAFLFSVGVVILAAALPAGLPTSSLLNKGHEYLRWPVDELQGDFNRLFAGLPARRPFPNRFFDSTLPFQGTISLSDDVVFTVKSSRPSYWRARSYPTYTSQGWASGATRIVPMGWQPEEGVPVSYQRRELVEQQVALNYSPRVLMAAGVAQESDINLVVQIPVPPTYGLSFADSGLDGLLPPDLQDLARRLRGMAEEREGLTEARIRSALYDDLELVALEADETGVLVGVTVRRPTPLPLDILSIRGQKRSSSLEQYTLISSVSVATPQELIAAGEEYPVWVRDLYLQLPDTLPQRVVDLARSLTAEAETPYDKALAIRDYLRTLSYSLDIPAPAFDADGVDHFLFKVGSGYSGYFASAMAVMLRSVEVPARMAVGYGVGDEDENGNIVVRDRNRHGWTEVFFPSYGWVEFEPTPGRSLPAYVGDASGERVPGIAGGVGLEDFLDEDLFPGPGGLLPEGRGFGRIVGIPGAIWVVLGGGLMGVAVLSTLGFRWLLSAPTTAAGVYGKMVRLSGLAGLGPHDGQTPREYGESLVWRLPAIERDAAVVVDAYSKGRYGHRALSESEQARVVRAWRAIRRTLFVRALRRKRWGRILAVGSKGAQ